MLYNTLPYGIVTFHHCLICNKKYKEATVNAHVLRSGLFFLVALLLSFNIFAKDAASIGIVAWADLPVEARKTLVLIKQGGPFPYAKDGVVFGNYEGVLPKQKRGYYHEFTVKTQESATAARGALSLAANRGITELLLYRRSLCDFQARKRVMACE